MSVNGRSAAISHICTLFDRELGTACDGTELSALNSYSEFFGVAELRNGGPESLSLVIAIGISSNSICSISCSLPYDLLHGKSTTNPQQIEASTTNLQEIEAMEFGFD